jgi:ankyrin repeat protein
LVERGVDVDATDERGQTALRWAVEYGRGMAAWLLLQGGANLNKTDVRGLAPLHAAVEHWSPGGGSDGSGGGASSSLLWMLLEHRPGAAEVDAKTRHGFTPLHIAAIGGYAPVVWLLLEKGANPTQQDTTGCTPLHCAATAGHVDVSRLLLAAQRGGAKLTRVVDNERRTALHGAASGGYPATVQLLLDGGALPVIDVRDAEGHTPLRLAVEKQHLDVVLCLVKRGADVNVVNKKGRTVLHLAMYDGNVAIIKALFEAENVDPTIKDGKGLTAWDVAERRGHDVNKWKAQGGSLWGT